MPDDNLIPLTVTSCLRATESNTECPPVFGKVSNFEIRDKVTADVTKTMQKVGRGFSRSILRTGVFRPRSRG